MKPTNQHRPPDILSTRIRKALSVQGYKYTPRKPQPGEALPPAVSLFQRPVWDGRVTEIEFAGAPAAARPAPPPPPPKPAPAASGFDDMDSDIPF